MEYCKKCNSELTGDYCSYCGNPKEIKRIDREYILSELGSVLNFDKGILFTIRELLLRPGKNIQTFIFEDRNHLVKPIIFIIICSLTYTVAEQFLYFEDGYANNSGPENSVTAIFEWIQKNYGYANIMMAFFIAFWIKVLFRKYDYNFFEILILLCFAMGIGMLIFTCFGIIESFTSIRVLQVGGVVGYLYAAWAIGQFFDKNKKVNYIKGLTSYLLGMVTFFFTAIVFGMLIDVIMKQ